MNLPPFGMLAGDSTPQSGGASTSEGVPSRDDDERLDRKLCQVGGLNENYRSGSGIPHHIQIEDRGPVFDDATEEWVRRLNTIVYAHYGEPDARIIYGRDEDYPGHRTPDHNRLIEIRVREAAAEVKVVLEERERVLDALDLAAQGMDVADALHVTASPDMSDFVTFDKALVRLAKRAKSVPVKVRELR